MSIVGILLDWVSSLTDPMKEFRAYANALNTNHSDSLQTFRQFLYQLDPNQALQQNTIINGDFANAMQQSGEDFLSTAQALSDLKSALSKLEEISARMEATSAEIEGSVEITAAELEGESVLIEITTDVDIAAVAEGGANPIADVAGFILTMIVGATIIDDLKNLAEDIYNDIQDLKRDLQDLQNAVNPPDAPEPKLGNLTVRPPKWKEDPNKWLSDPAHQAELQPLMDSYRYLGGNIQDDLIYLLEMGLTPDQIKTIMDKLQKTGASNADIMAFLDGLVNGGTGAYPDSPSPAKIMQWFNGITGPKLKDVVLKYAQIAQIPGASRLLERLISSNNTTPDQGYYYELTWCAAHANEIARIEDIAPDGAGKKIVQAADVVMKSGPFTKGAIVDLKSFSWRNPQDKSQPMTLEQENEQIDRWLKQVAGDKKNYPGYPIVYVFDSSKPLPQVAIDRLSQAGVTVMTAPPDKVVAIGQNPLPPSNQGGSGTPLLPPSGGTPQLPPGGSGTPQLPPGE
ncbi:MAG TPA: hypothetical protein VFV38_12210 [Ktedonobacteraceae bacterium]|nr:hypothetical protein [Ktedonobacteraceae bacterium]